MQTKRLGRTGLEITRVGFGAWAIGGGDYAFGWGPQDDQDSIAAIARAVDLGMNWIDTAPVYGLGRSEEVVGRALEQIPAGRRPYVFTKCSLVWKDGSREVLHSLDPDSIRRECEASLRRLGVETIDLYQVHWARWTDVVDPSTDRLEDGWSALADLKKAGKVRHIGVSNFKVDDMERASRVAPVETLQPPYSLLRRKIEEEILPYCQAHDIGVIVYSPMQAGILSGRMTRERVEGFPEDDWRRRTREYQEPNLSRNLAFADVLRTVGERHGRTAGEVAIAWTLRHPAVTAAIVGFRRAQQVGEIAGAADLQLTGADVEEIERAIPTVAPQAS
ncbi:MAG TPA: aldo/keto reductase [Vicinamibacterales bacterium]|nr:aldo/keto reductase [Vicinamibacterales bacterium]